MSSGVWYRTLVYLGLKEEPEPGYDEPIDTHDDAEVTARHRSERREPARFDPVDDPDLRPRRAGSDDAERHEDGASNVRQLRGAPGVTEPADVRLSVVEIGRFDDVEDVGSRYRTGAPVLFDVTGADRGDARRVIDFVAGLTYALRGRMDRVGTRAFLLVPEGVALPLRETERLQALGYRLPVESP